jgi:hypothetical protein
VYIVPRRVDPFDDRLGERDNLPTHSCLRGCAHSPPKQRCQNRTLQRVLLCRALFLTPTPTRATTQRAMRRERERDAVQTRNAKRWAGGLRFCLDVG